MIYIISGTNRPQSNTLRVSKVLEGLYKERKQSVEIMDLAKLPFDELNGSTYAENKSKPILAAIDKLTKADGWVVVCPEYNGSYPGVLKLFIDHFKFPDTFEYRPIAFVGLGGRFGGLRPVEHLQGVFGYRNAFIYPRRVFLLKVDSVFQDGVIQDPILNKELNLQTDGFIKFVRALKSERLDASSVLNK